MKISCKNRFNVIYGFRRPSKWIRLMNLTFSIQDIKKVKKYQTCQRGSKKIKHPRTLYIQTRETKNEQQLTAQNMYTRATLPPDEKDTFLNDRRLTHNHRLVKYMYMSMRRCDARL